MGAAGKSTFGRDDVVAVIGIFLHHLLGCAETDLAEPYPEVGMLALVEEQAQLILRDAERTGKREHICVAVLVALILTPGIQSLLDEVPAFIRNYLQLTWVIICRILLYARIFLCPPQILYFRFQMEDCFPLPCPGALR